MKSSLKEIFDVFIEEGTAEELQVLEVLLNGIHKNKHKKRSTYISRALDITECFIDDMHYEVKMPYTPFLQNTMNHLHGGITATLIDIAMGTFANKIIPDHLAAVTAEIKVNYVAPGTGDEIRCLVSIIHKGSKTIVMEGKVFRDDNRLIAHATGSFFIIPRKL